MKIIEKIFLYGWIGGMLVLLGGYLLIMAYGGVALVWGLFVKPSTVEKDSISNESVYSISPSPTPAAIYDPTFGDNPCTVDCSGHEAGYEWAEEKGITQDDVDNYSGNSDSFREGMQSYVDDNE